MVKEFSINFYVEGEWRSYRLLSKSKHDVLNTIANWTDNDKIVELIRSTEQFKIEEIKEVL